MSTSYPTGIDSYSTKVDNVTATAAADINDPQDAIEAIEAKVGVDNSAVNTSIDYFLKHASGAYRIHQHDATSDDGAKLDWNVVWSDAVHTHESNAEGGTISIINATTGTLTTARGGSNSTADANAASGIVVLDASSKLPAVDASQLTTLNASELDSGTVPTARISSLFGAWVNCTAAAAHDNELAATDGFVLANGISDGTKAYMTVYSDSNNPPTTMRANPQEGDEGSGVGKVSAMVPVRNGDRWKVVMNAGTITSVYWLSSGS